MVFNALRRDIAMGAVADGDYLPSEVEIAKRHGVAPMTARRALKMVEAKGLIRAEPRRGYRVLARGNDPTKGHPLAFLVTHQAAGSEWYGFNSVLLEGLRKAASNRGWPLLGVGAKELPVSAAIEQCRVARAWGAVIDAPDAELVEAAAKIGLSVVLMDDWHEDAHVDTVLQDDFRGGFLAGRYLARRGHKRIAWFGADPNSIHHMQRMAGAQAALRRAGVEPTADWATVKPSEQARAAVRERFSRPDRPTAVLALWRDWAEAVGRVSGEMGLTLGRDLEMVGWCTRQQYDRNYAIHFADGRVPPAIVWDAGQMVEMAIARLEAQRRQPDLPPALMQVDVSLRDASQAYLDELSACGQFATFDRKAEPP